MAVCDCAMSTDGHGSCSRRREKGVADNQGFSLIWMKQPQSSYFERQAMRERLKEDEDYVRRPRETLAV